MSAVSCEQKKSRDYIPPAKVWPIFAGLARYRALTVEHVHGLFSSYLGESSLRNTRGRVQTWVRHGYLQDCRLPMRPPPRFLYLTHRAFQHWPELHHLVSEQGRKAPKPELAIHAWHRASLALAFRAQGYTVGRDIAALIALRRFLIDSQRARIEQANRHQREALAQALYALRDYALLQPWVVFECRGCGLELPIGSPKPGRCGECGQAFDVHVVHQPYACSICHQKSSAGGTHVIDGVTCPGTLRAVDYLPFDLAYKKTQAGYDVKVLLADHPFRSVATQLAELPLRIMGQTKVDIIVRPCEDGSVYDVRRRTYAVRGPRYRQYLRAFSQDDAKPDAFPYWMTANLLPEHVFPKTHFRKLRAA